MSEDNDNKRLMEDIREISNDCMRKSQAKNILSSAIHIIESGFDNKVTNQTELKMYIIDIDKKVARILDKD